MKTTTTKVKSLKSQVKALASKHKEVGVKVTVVDFIGYGYEVEADGAHNVWIETEELADFVMARLATLKASYGRYLTQGATLDKEDGRDNYTIGRESYPTLLTIHDIA